MSSVSLESYVTGPSGPPPRSHILPCGLFLSDPRVLRVRAAFWFYSCHVALAPSFGTFDFQTSVQLFPVLNFLFMN